MGHENMPQSSQTFSFWIPLGTSVPRALVGHPPLLATPSGHPPMLSSNCFVIIIVVLENKLSLSFRPLANSCIAISYTPVRNLYRSRCGVQWCLSFVSMLGDDSEASVSSRWKLIDVIQRWFSNRASRLVSFPVDVASARDTAARWHSRRSGCIAGSSFPSIKRRLTCKLFEQRG